MPEIDQDRERGLYDKYEVTKDGEEVSGCFVLEPNDDPAAREAIRAYADATENEKLAGQLRLWADRYQPSEDQKGADDAEV